MDEGEAIARYGLPPAAEALPEIRAALDEETRREADEQEDTLVLKDLCVLLFAAGQVDDALRIWRAKRASFDAFSSVDVQLLCGAGFAATVDHLRALDTEESRDALAYILECDASGDFEGHDAPDGRLARIVPAARRYYGLPSP